jgi:hypothetical protein
MSVLATIRTFDCVEAAGLQHVSASICQLIQTRNTRQPINKFFSIVNKKSSCYHPIVFFVKKI